MATATVVRTGVGGFPSADATLYRLDPPLPEHDGNGNVVTAHDHVVVLTTPTYGHAGPEGKLYPATPEGAVKGFTMRALVRYTHAYAPNHAGVLFLAGGYDIVAAEQ